MISLWCYANTCWGWSHLSSLTPVFPDMPSCTTLPCTQCRSNTLHVLDLSRGVWALIPTVDIADVRLQDCSLLVMPRRSNVSSVDISSNLTGALSTWSIFLWGGSRQGEGQLQSGFLPGNHRQSLPSRSRVVAVHVTNHCSWHALLHCALLTDGLPACWACRWHHVRPKHRVLLPQHLQ
jgi:hypothetical protein